MAKSAVSMQPTLEDFESLLAESYLDRPVNENTVVKGKVLAIENDFVIIDVGLKTEGKVPLKELVRESTDIIERLCIEAALQMNGDNRAGAAEMLGLSRQSLYVKLHRYGIDDMGVAEIAN